ncbi:MAG: T9SS type A sorting domain-containing protein [Lewinella sp.]|nr:T9SS type A sorting domain-containing protein [Lewinella sp.]
MNKILFASLLLLTIPIYLMGQGTWELLNPTPSYRTGLDIHFFSAEHGYIITDAFQLLETTDAGENWQLKRTFSGFDFFQDFAFFDALGLITGEDGRVLLTEDGGENWAEIDIGISQDLHTVNIMDSETIYISGASQLAKSIDGGSSWVVLDLPHEYTKSVVFTSTQVGHAAGQNGAIFKTIDGGQSWYVAAADVDFTSNFVTLYFHNENLGFASLSNNELYKTTDGGENWEMIPDITELFYAFFFVDESTGYAGGKNGTLFKTTDGGENWASVEFQDDRYDYTSIYGLYFFNENVGFTVGNRGRITKTIDGGETWSEYSPTYNDLAQIYFPANEIGYARLQQHDIFKTTDAGITWGNMGRPFADKKTGNFFFVSEDVGYAIAGGEHISDPKEFVYKTTNGGLSWAPTNGEDPLEEDIDLNSLYFLDEQNGYASGNRYAANRRVFKTTNGGATWSLVGEMRLTKMQFLSDTLGYGIGYQGNTLYKTTNSGANWEEFFVADARITDFDFVSPTHGYIVTSGAFMYKTANAGTDWQVLDAAPTILENVEFVTPDVGYINTGDKIYSTEDGGDTWEFEVQAIELWDICMTDDQIFTCGTYGKILSSNHDAVSSQVAITTPDLNVSIFPNPADEDVYLSLEGEHKITSVAVFDMTGKRIQIAPSINDTPVKFTLPEIAAGLYIVQITLDNKYIISRNLMVH